MKIFLDDAVCGKFSKSQLLTIVVANNVSTILAHNMSILRTHISSKSSNVKSEFSSSIMMIMMLMMMMAVKNKAEKTRTTTHPLQYHTIPYHTILLIPINHKQHL